MTACSQRLVRALSHAISGSSTIITSSIWIDHSTLLIEWDKPSRFSSRIAGLTATDENWSNQDVVPAKVAPRRRTATAAANRIESHMTGRSRHSRRTPNAPRWLRSFGAARRRRDSPSTKPLST